MQAFMEDIKTDSWKLDCGNTVSWHSSVAGFCGVVVSYFTTEYSTNHTSILRKNRGDLYVKGQFVYLILWCCTAVPGNMCKNYCEWNTWLETAHCKTLFQDPAMKHKESEVCTWTFVCFMPATANRYRNCIRGVPEFSTLIVGSAYRIYYSCVPLHTAKLIYCDCGELQVPFQQYVAFLCKWCSNVSVLSAFCDCGRPVKWQTLRNRELASGNFQRFFDTKCFQKPAVMAAGVEHNLFVGTQKWPMLVEILNIQVVHNKLEW